MGFDRLLVSGQDHLRHRPPGRERLPQEARVLPEVLGDRVQPREVPVVVERRVERPLRRQLLEKALSYYKGFIDQRQDDKNEVVALELTQDNIKRILDELTVIQGITQLNVIGNFPVVLEELKISTDQAKQMDELIKTWEARREQLNDEAKDSSSGSACALALAYAREGEELLVS